MKMSEVFFSVLIPVYNQVGKMDDCMAALNDQTFRDFEVIMVDDGSTDDSYKMLCEFAEKDSRIKVLRQEKNSSLVGARYAGMKNASGRYIFLLDSDDYIENNTFEVLHNRLVETDPDILCFGFWREPMHEEVPAVSADDMLDALITDKVIPAVWKNVYKKSLTDKVVENTEPFYCNMGEDVYFSTVFYTFAEKIDRIDDILYHYKTDSGMSSADTVTVLNMEKYRRILKDTNVSREHIMSFLEKYAPERLEAAKEMVIRMNGFVFLQYIIFEKDYRNIIELAYEYKRQGMDDVYDMVCNNTLKMKAMIDEGVAYVENGKFYKKEIVNDE